MPISYKAPYLDKEACKTFSKSQENLSLSLRTARGYENLDSEQIIAKIQERKPDAEQFITSQHSIDSLPFLLHDQNGMSITLNGNHLKGSGSITIENCRDFILTAHGTCSLSQTDKFFLKISNCHNFIVRGLRTNGGQHTLMITDSKLFSVIQLQSEDGQGYGIIIFNSCNFTLEHCRIENNLAGIMVVGRSQQGGISNCSISRLRGFCNCDAGVHLCATSRAITPEDLPERCHEPLPIDQKTWRPQAILIHRTTCYDCRAQGIYLEGAVNCLIQSNMLINNNKEGICFDWGSCFNIFVENAVTLNGERRGLSEEEIRVDFITRYPLLEDGSSSMKLPGISIDNGCMNLIAANKIASNYGGGIKMIRSAILNSIYKNSILANNIGNNRFVPPFHGISVLGVGAGTQEFTKGKNTLLDFLPSEANLISDNVIRENGYPIFLDSRCRKNIIRDNSIGKNPACINNKTILKKKISAFLRRWFWRYFRIPAKKQPTS